ncbi:MAG: carboxypeptidase-like regulatory domain-containing protein [Acidobacteriota bacterium]
MKPRQEDQNDSQGQISDEVRRALWEASEAETGGHYALASLLALHALQLDPARAEASAILERCQARLGRPKGEVETPQLPLSRVASDPWGGRLPPGPPQPPKQSIESLFRDDTLRHPIDLRGVPPLTPGPKPRGLGSRIFRAVLPSLVLGLLITGIWLTSSRTNKVRSPVPAPAVAEPEAAADPDPVADRGPGALAPGTVALNIVPWARVDVIYSVYDGREIEPDGLVSPCTVYLPPGRYRFTVSHPDFGSADLPLIVRSGEFTRIDHSLISRQQLEKELAPALKSAGYPAGRTSEAVINQSAALRR